MTDQAIKPFGIEIQTKKSGHKMLSTKINGQHGVGFIVSKEDKNSEGETYLKELANMKPCDGEKCQVCDPDEILI